MVKIFENYDLSNLNTFGITSFSKFFATINTYSDLCTIIESKMLKNVPKLILGGGSNVIFSETNFEGIILHNKIRGINVVEETNEHIIIEVGGGENWHALVSYTLENNWKGLENLSLIPGSVGAAPIQNIGAYGVELKDVFLELEAWNLETGEIRHFSGEECAFGYRNSVFKNELKGKYFIAKVSFKLDQQKELNIKYGAIEKWLQEHNIQQLNAKAVSKAIIAIRESKLPNPELVGNVGSFFKNPIISASEFEILKTEYADLKFYQLENNNYKIPAAWLIEKCGFRGCERGNVGVSPKHALVLINLGKAKGKEVVTLANEIIKVVKQEFRIELEPEANII